MPSYYHSLSGRRCEEDDLLDCSINHDHAYRPTFKFFSTNLDNDESAFYGLELEMNSMIDKELSAKTLLMGVNEAHRQFYCKYDGSLRYGFEFNSMPMTLNYLKSNFDEHEMNALFENAEVFSSFDCGFHIHISRTKLNTEEKIKAFMLNVANMNMFILHNSGRASAEQVHRYSRLLVRSNEIMEVNTYNRKSLVSVGKYTKQFNPSIVNRMWENGLQDRYSAVNCTNSSTVELRIYGGTVNWTTVMDRVIFVDALVEASCAGVVFRNELDMLAYSKDERVLDYISKGHRNMLRQLRFGENVRKMGLAMFNDTNSQWMSESLYRIPFSKVKIGDTLISRNRRCRIGYEVVRVIDSENFMVMPLWGDIGDYSVKMVRVRSLQDFIAVRNLIGFAGFMPALPKTLFEFLGWRDPNDSISFEEPLPQRTNAGIPARVETVRNFMIQGNVSLPINGSYCDDDDDATEDLYGYATPTEYVPIEPISDSDPYRMAMDSIISDTTYALPSWATRPWSTSEDES